MPPSSVPVYLLCHEEGLAAWLPGLDGVAIVAANKRAAGAYAAWTVVDAEPKEAPLALAEAAIMRFGAPDDSAQASLGDIFDRRDAGMVAGLRSEAGRTRHRRPEFPPLLHVDGIRADTVDARPAVTPDPIDLLVAESARTERDAPPRGNPSVTSPIRVRSRLRERLPLLRKRADGLGISDAEIAGLLVGRAPTLVVIGSRKGGVGKTSHAAGIAILAGALLELGGPQRRHP